jgi:GAF domain-containing protein
VKALEESRSVPEAMEAALDFLSQDLKAERGLVLFEGRGAARGLDPETIWTFGQVSQELLRNVLREGQPVLLHDAIRDPRYGDRNSVILSGLRSILCVPLKARDGRVCGLLYCDNNVRAGAFGPGHLEKAIAFGRRLEATLFSLPEAPRVQEGDDFEHLFECQWL